MGKLTISMAMFNSKLLNYQSSTFIYPMEKSMVTSPEFATWSRSTGNDPGSSPVAAKSNEAPTPYLGVATWRQCHGWHHLDSDLDPPNTVKTMVTVCKNTYN